MPTVTLSPIMLDSRISGGGVALEKPRLGLVTSETGAQTIVTYSTPDCTQGNLPTTAQIPTNTRRCMPVYYSSGTAAPTLQWFNKYVVTKVTERDLTATTDYGVAGLGLDIAADQDTNYTYSSDGAWRYNDSPIVKAKYRTWGQWRGYGKVTTTTGSGSVKEVEEATYFRGMNGDRASSTGGTKNVTVTDSTGTTWPDDDWLAGMTRETRTFTGASGTEDSGEITDPHVQPTMSGSVAVADGRLTSRQVDTAKTVSRQKTASGVRKGSETVLAWDAYGQPTKTEDQGDLAVSGDETCTRAVYAAPATAATGPIDRVAETSVSPGTCSGEVNYATALSAVRHHYGTASHTDPVSVPALETKTVQLRDGNPRPWVTTATVSFDTWGRPLTTADALGNTSTVSYSHTTGGLVSSSTSTSADPDGAGALTPLATTVTFDTRLAAPVKTVQPGGETTEATLDALGRVTAVWQPGRAKATQTASSTMAYTISKTAPSSVTTDTLLPNGTGYTTSVSLLDSMLRPRQAQTKSAAGGRLIADTRYDSRGNAVLTDSYYNSSAPAASLVQPANRGDIANSHRVSYDFVGRATKDALYNQEVFKWETLTSYQGDRTKVTPPAGGTPTTTVEDIEGNTTQLIQHLGSATATTSYTYDLLGRLTAMVDDKGNKWSYSYDLAGNKVTSKDPDKGQTSMTYDAAGQLTSSTDARDVTLKFFYDNLGRATKTTKADGTTTLISTSYDTVKKGLVSSTSRHLPGGTIVNRVDSYDTAGRTTGSSVVVPEITGLIGSQLAGTYATTTSYNADGSINTTTLPSTGPIPAETLTTTYTGLTGLPKTLTGSLGSTSATYVTDTQYLQWGTVAAMLFGTHAGKASMATWTRDPGTQRLIGMDLHRQVNPGVTDENTAINYDPAGNITQVKATLPGQVDNQCFSYDHQQQLTEAWTPTTATCDPEARSQSALAGPAPYWTSWATNTIGKTTNRTDRTATTSSSTNYSYPGDGATSTRPHFITGSTITGDNPGTASYTADAAGNTTKRPAPGGGNQDLVWDELNQLTEVTKAGTTVAKMVYDAAGERVLRQQGDNTTLYVAGSEITLNTATSNLAANRYYNHAGQTVAMRTAASNDTVSTLIPDWQGTTHHQINNATGALSTTWQDPYGNPRGTPPTTWEGERGFVGGTKDATGLTRIGARDYDPVLQRFITVDPIQDLADPLQWNPYLYANNSPITKADPTGLWPNWGQLFNGIVNIAKAIYKHLPKPFKKALAPVKKLFKSFNWGARSKGSGSGSQGKRPTGSSNPCQRSGNCLAPAKPMISLQMPQYGSSSVGTVQVSPYETSCTPGVCKQDQRQPMSTGDWFFLGSIFGAFSWMQATVKAPLSAAAPGSGKSTTSKPSGGVAAKTADDWPILSGIVRDASKGKGDFGVGSGTASQATRAGESWVREGYRIASDGKTLVSRDGLRTFRPPSWKPDLGKYQANFSYWVGERVGKPVGNGHLDITDMGP